MLFVASLSTIIYRMVWTSDTLEGSVSDGFVKFNFRIKVIVSNSPLLSEIVLNVVNGKSSRLNLLLDELFVIKIVSKSHYLTCSPNCLSISQWHLFDISNPF